MKRRNILQGLFASIFGSAIVVTPPALAASNNKDVPSNKPKFEDVRKKVVDGILLTDEEVSVFSNEVNRLANEEHYKIYLIRKDKTLTAEQKRVKLNHFREYESDVISCWIDVCDNHKHKEGSPTLSNLLRVHKQVMHAILSIACTTPDLT